jgi:hypothetical protein
MLGVTELLPSVAITLSVSGPVMEDTAELQMRRELVTCHIIGVRWWKSIACSDDNS